MTDIHGQVDSGYDAIRDAFKSNFDDQGEVGAAFCLYKDGKKVVDVWGGTTDTEGATPYPENALQIIFSTTKGATAICAHMLVDRGALDLDKPVVAYWPEFGANGKEDIPVRMLLNHRAGLPVIDGQLSLDQVLAVEPVVAALAAQKPVWEPGTKHGYHALTYGWLVGELVKRVSGKSIGTFFQDEIAGPLGLDFWMGLPESEESRVVPLLPAPAPDNPEMLAVMMDSNALLPRALSLNGAFAMVPGTENPFNTRKVHAAEIPAGGGHCHGAGHRKNVCSDNGRYRWHASLEQRRNGNGPAGTKLCAR